MRTSTSSNEQAETTVTARYWAGARAAAGVGQDVFQVVGPITLAEVVELVLAAHPDAGFARTIAVCSVLVGDRPVGSEDPGAVQVEPASTVEFLPPFAGG